MTVKPFLLLTICAEASLVELPFSITAPFSRKSCWAKATDTELKVSKKNTKNFKQEGLMTTNFFVNLTNIWQANQLKNVKRVRSGILQSPDQSMKSHCDLAIKRPECEFAVI